MAFYNIICWDKPHAAHIRQAHQDAHIAYITNSENVIFAGPFLDESGTQMIGCQIVVDVASRKQAEDWADREPLQRAGLFANVEIHPWRHSHGGLPQK